MTRTDAEQLDEELRWASSRPSSMWDDAVPPSHKDPSAFAATLTENEAKFLAKYLKESPMGMYSLNQDPDVTNMKSNGQVMWST